MFLPRSHTPHPGYPSLLMIWNPFPQTTASTQSFALKGRTKSECYSCPQLPTGLCTSLGIQMPCCHHVSSYHLCLCCSSCFRPKSHLPAALGSYVLQPFPPPLLVACKGIHVHTVHSSASAPANAENCSELLSHPTHVCVFLFQR